MKTFFNLIQEIQKPGFCHHCGGCVTFCAAINYGALEMDEDGKPRYADIEKCIECGLCYAICPEIDDLEAETKRQVSWSEPMGRIIETTVLRASDKKTLAKATDGGVVTGLLLHLFDRGRIDGAIVTQQVDAFQRRPHLATTREEILEAAGFYFDTSHGMEAFSDDYQTHSSIEEFDPMVKKGLNRVALVGTPCQIKAVRRMQVLGVVPSDTIKYCLGLFCSGNFIFGQAEQQRIAELGQFTWDAVKKINIKENLMVHLKSGDTKTIELDELDTMKRYACRYCPDYSAEYADVSFGGIGADEGWTTIITRTAIGRTIIADAKREGALVEYNYEDKKDFASTALSKIRLWSTEKKRKARHNRRELGKKSVHIKE